MQATVLQGRWSGDEVSPRPEESGEHRAVRLGGGSSAPSPWLSPQLWLTIAVLIGGLMVDYFADLSSDRQQLATLEASRDEFSRHLAKMEGQVESIKLSAKTLSDSQISQGKDIEALRRDIEALKDQKDTFDAWIAQINKSIARLEARAGIN